MMVNGPATYPFSRDGHHVTPWPTEQTFRKRWQNLKYYSQPEMSISYDITCWSGTGTRRVWITSILGTCKEGCGFIHIVHFFFFIFSCCHHHCQHIFHRQTARLCASSSTCHNVSSESTSGYHHSTRLVLHSGTYFLSFLFSFTKAWNFLQLDY